MYRLEHLLNLLPDHYIMVKDSGVWQIYLDEGTDEQNSFYQGINESFRSFLERVLISLKVNFDQYFI